MLRPLILAVLTLPLWPKWANAAPPRTELPVVAPSPAKLDTAFSDGSRDLSLDAGRGGRPLLLNVWATWCPPCVKELPALDLLAGKLLPEVVVVALSTDDGGPAQVRPFLDKLGVTRLSLWYDRDGKSFQDFALRGLPTTLLIDADGRIVARLEGVADWDSPAIAAQIRRLVARPQTPGR
jgi:thiol-disulfide isomerase/thioredoxin